MSRLSHPIYFPDKQTPQRFSTDWINLSYRELKILFEVSCVTKEVVDVNYQGRNLEVEFILL